MIAGRCREKEDYVVDTMCNSEKTELTKECGSKQSNVLNQKKNCSFPMGKIIGGKRKNMIRSDKRIK